MNNALIWFGIALCVFQSALCSGSNIAVFSLSRLRLLTVCDVAMYALPSLARQACRLV